MVFWGCSDVVESRVEHLFSMPKAAGMQFLLRIRNSPGALSLGDARSSDSDLPRRVGLSIDELGDLSIDRIIGEGKVAPTTKRLSNLVAQGTASEGVEVV